MKRNTAILTLTSDMLYHTRRQLGLSQEKMAERLRISRREYQYIEYGEKCPSLETYSNLVTLCDTDALKTLSAISEISQKSRE